MVLSRMTQTYQSKLFDPHVVSPLFSSDVRVLFVLPTQR